MDSDREFTNSDAAARAASSPFSRAFPERQIHEGAADDHGRLRKERSVRHFGRRYSETAATGSFEAARTRASLSANSAGSDFRAPVTPATVT